jgi:non-canonical purine NTP pyrophosphatase (RdgB/HAM1 family)
MGITYVAQKETYMKDFTFITGNLNKAKQVENWLGTHVSHHKVDLNELQTLDIHELATHKAKQAYGMLHSPVLIEDASLSFTALGRLPGPFIKWFNEELGGKGLIKLLDGFDDRSARAVCCYALYDGTEMRFFEGEMRGHIAHEPRGSGGFGFDPVFINEGFQITRAEMSEEDYAETSYRKLALDKLKTFLEQQ